MKVADIFENTEKEVKQIYKNEPLRDAIISASRKIEKLVNDTNWLRIGTEDSQVGGLYYGPMLRRTYQSNGAHFSIDISGKYIPDIDDVYIPDLFDGDKEAKKSLIDKWKSMSVGKPTLEEIREWNKKSERLIIATIRTIQKMDLGHFKLGFVGYYKKSPHPTDSYMQVPADQAVDDLLDFPINMSDHYAPHVHLFFYYIP